MRNFTRHVLEWCAQRGVAPIELLIVVLVLGVLASLIVPPFTVAAPGMRDASQKDAALRDTLQFVRTQIAVFKAQHHEVPPGYPDDNIKLVPDGITFAKQLSEYSDASGRLSATPGGQYPLGKYLDAIPANPISGKSAVWVSTAAASALIQANQRGGFIILRRWSFGLI